MASKQLATLANVPSLTVGLLTHWSVYGYLSSRLRLHRHSDVVIHAELERVRT